MKIERVGLSMFRIETEKGLVLLTDPWISGSPTTVAGFNTPDNLSKIAVLLVTHGHLDHAPGIFDVVKVNPDVPVVCHFELGNLLLAQGVKNVHRLNIGGTAGFGQVKVTLVSAAHSSTFGRERTPAGPAAGVIITLENGYRVYYAGDTGMTADMKLVIGDYFKPDLAILPVGGVVTMDCDQAAYAAGELIRAGHVIPCHYFPNPQTAPDPSGMAKMLELMPSIAEMMGDKGNELKRIVQKRYPRIKTTVLELGQSATIETSGGR